ncbi:unnamed protein product, partial [Ixodes pacificus]
GAPPKLPGRLPLHARLRPALRFPPCPPVHCRSAPSAVPGCARVRGGGQVPATLRRPVAALHPAGQVPLAALRLLSTPDIRPTPRRDRCCSSASNATDYDVAKDRFC